MRPPQIPTKPKMRIDRSMKWQMLIVAAIFDTLMFVPKLFPIIGIAGALVVGWIPFFGQVAGAAAIGATMALNMMFTWLFMMIGYSWMWGWLLSRDVPIFGGHKLEKKALIFPLVIIADMMPLIGTLMPGITVWTYTQIRFAQEEDRERHAKAVERAKAELHVFQLRMRRRAEQEAYLEEQAMLAAAANVDASMAEDAANAAAPRRSTAPLRSQSGQLPVVARTA